MRHEPTGPQAFRLAVETMGLGGGVVFVLLQYFLGVGGGELAAVLCSLRTVGLIRDYNGI